jgi:endoglucanase
MGILNTMLARAHERNMKVFFDMHDYGQFNEQSIGTAAVPYSAYQDVWQKISAYFAASPYKSALFGYDIMNEPNKLGLGDVWPTAAKYAIAGIRAHDMTSYIVAEGKYWAGAHNWDIYNGDIGFIDPACRLIYSAHSYWDSDASGTKYSTTYEEGVDYLNKGVDRLKPFVTWVTKRKFRGLIGEYGVPTNPYGATPSFVPDQRWHTMLDRALSYMENNGISGTYWSGGYGWAAYNLLCDTFQNGQPVDAPAMSVLQNYSQ